MLYHNTLPGGDLVTEITHRQRICVQHTISCITQSNAPEDGQNVELI